MTAHRPARQATEEERRQLITKAERCEPLQYEEIALLFGVTRQRVTQIHDRAIRKLRKLIPEESL